VLAFGAALMTMCFANSVAAATFRDSFDVGALSSAQSGFAWRPSTETVTVSSVNSLSGNYALALKFAAVADGQDDMAQATMDLPKKGEYWFHYKLFVPSNYYHRTQSGAANNKFLAVYAAPYSTPGFQINFSTEPNGSGGSNLEVHYYNNGREQPVKSVASNFISDAEKGKWNDILVQVKAPTSSGSNDGVLRMWRNNKMVCDLSNLASYGGSSNFISQAYFLGWSNSGFTQTTTFYIDDLEVSDSPLSSVAPEAPKLSVE
jgi:hypothetical protein